ncbi:hypothetical protein ACFL1D_05700, partial [Candidatus Omnitrophota bacterium]
MNRSLFRILFCAIIILSANPCFAQAESLNLVAESKYFSLYGDSSLDLNSLLEKLDFDYSLHPDMALGGYGAGEERSTLSKTLDALYLEVSDILDIHIYSFHAEIRLFADQDSVSAQFREFFKMDFNERSFYLPEKNAIYVSFGDLTPGMLAHEIAHAIICKYFVVPPPARVQEVLCG